jgi:hypothetical protein
MLLPSAAANAATVNRDRNRVETQVNTCNGETIVLEGWSQFTGSPGALLFTVHLEGVGSDGNEYVYNEQLREVGSTLNGRLLLVSTGSAPNRYFTFQLDFETEEFSGSVECLG